MDDFFSSEDAFFTGFVPGFFKQNFGTGKDPYINFLERNTANSNNYFSIKFCGEKV
jgi:hypothetical protein